MINDQFLYNILIIDIETVPVVSAFQNLSPEWQQLFVDKISKILPESTLVEDFYKQKAGILAEFGKIVCISVGYYYKDAVGTICLRLKSICCTDEMELLQSFIQLVDRFKSIHPNFQFAGHNIREFDIPFICRRLLIHQIALPIYFQLQGAKPWEINMMDTLQWWKFGDYKNYISLHLLANALGIATSKDDIDGSKVQDVYYIDNDIQRIVNYCQKDVVVVAQVILRFKNIPLLHHNNIVVAT